MEFDTDKAVTFTIVAIVVLFGYLAVANAQDGLYCETYCDNLGCFTVCN